MQCQCQGIRYSRKRVNFSATGLAGASLMQNAIQYKNNLTNRNSASLFTLADTGTCTEILWCQDHVKILSSSNINVWTEKLDARVAWWVEGGLFPGHLLYQQQ